MSLLLLWLRRWNRNIKKPPDLLVVDRVCWGPGPWGGVIFTHHEPVYYIDTQATRSVCSAQPRADWPVPAMWHSDAAAHGVHYPASNEPRGQGGRGHVEEVGLATQVGIKFSLSLGLARRHQNRRVGTAASKCLTLFKIHCSALQRRLGRGQIAEVSRRTVYIYIFIYLYIYIYKYIYIYIDHVLWSRACSPPVAAPAPFCHLPIASQYLPSHNKRPQWSV